VAVARYRDGQAPLGVWTPARLIVAPQWASSSDPDFDVGFVVLKPLDGKTIEQVLGANQLGIDPGYHNLVRVTGYPDSAGVPVTCANWTSEQSPSQLRFDCGGFTGGTSGSPWVTDFNPLTWTGNIVGVIGGYQGGGDTPATSYSAYLGEHVEQLYRQAVADEAARPEPERAARGCPGDVARTERWIFRAAWQPKLASRTRDQHDEAGDRDAAGPSGQHLITCLLTLRPGPAGWESNAVPLTWVMMNDLDRFHLVMGLSALESPGPLA
jgi:hypothetical protein